MLIIMGTLQHVVLSAFVRRIAVSLQGFACEAAGISGTLGSSDKSLCSSTVYVIP